jgi:hypothetical protein
MFGTNTDLGASLFKTWDETQKRDEIAKLVEGYRAGVPVGILCKMSETIAGNRKKARKHLRALMTPAEREGAVAAAAGGLQTLVKEYLL